MNHSNRYMFKITDPCALDELNKLGNVYLISKIIGVYAIETDRSLEEIAAVENVVNVRRPEEGAFY